MNRGTFARVAGLCLTGTGLFLFSTVAEAAPAPDGSYQQSCRNFTASRGTLTGECKNRAGSWVNTTLENYRNCEGDISNNNGTLTCNMNDDEDDRTGDRDRSRDDASRGGDDDDRMRAPRGSYRDSCRNQRVDGDDLVAECRTIDGNWHRTTLDDFRRCNGDISNNDGRLRCDRDGGRDARDDDDDRGRGRGDDDRRGGWKPDGSYQDTCRRVRVDGNDLNALCRTRSGGWRETELEDFRECRGDISNDNGNLVCSRGGRARITLYQHARFGGRSRSFGDDQPWLGDFADMASSAVVQRGRWQLCTQRYYRGRCVTIDTTVGNFNLLGINDRVESIRRVR